jgi:3',5'-cyclic AMP phosphodiesterase CpdA
MRAPRPLLTRRRFLASSFRAAAGATLTPAAHRAFAAPAIGRRLAFVLLGDLHFDRPEHHDLEWVRREKPNDVRQIEGYCRNTREVTPRLFATVRATVADLNRDPATRVAAIVQAGDLVEGLCGSEALAVRHHEDAVAFVREARLGAPFLFTKGNHDITGPGAPAAYAQVFHPFLGTEARALDPGAAALTHGSYTVTCGPAQFAFLDAYETAKSLEWLEAVAARRTAEHFFVVVHPPVVPYGARSTWHLLASARDRARREKLLALLGEQHAIVLGGHIHRFNALARTAGRGRFAQFALSSVLTAPTVRPKEVLAGLAAYTPDQIKVEPNFSPANEAERRAVYEAERPFVRAFDYADLPGYAVVKIDGPRVTLDLFAGTTRERWRSVDLAALARGA